MDNATRWLLGMLVGSIATLLLVLFLTHRERPRLSEAQAAGYDVDPSTPAPTVYERHLPGGFVVLESMSIHEGYVKDLKRDICFFVTFPSGSGETSLDYSTVPCEKVMLVGTRR